MTAPPENKQMMTLAHDGDVAIATMDDGRGNAIDAKLLGELRDVLRRTRDAGALVLEGRQKVFSGGLDLPALLALDRPALEAFLELFDLAHEELFSHPVPIVTAASGSAVAGGAILFASGDVRLATPRGKIGVNEVALGLNLPTPTLEILRRALGDRGLAEAAQTGTLYEGEERLRVGFATAIVEPADLRERALDEARRFARTDRVALAALREALHEDGRRRIARDGAGTRARFADLWFSDPTRQRLQALVATLQRRSA